MRPIPALLVLLATTVPACAQGVERHLYLDAHWFTPSISGHFTDTTGNNPIDVDLKNDLGLTRDKTKVGFGAEYQGPRFGFELSRDEQDYAGKANLNRTITINNQQFVANTLVTSTLKATNNTVNWTIRALSLRHFWVGLDLGARVVQTELDVSGNNPPTETASYKTTLPVPQIGPSLGIVAMNGRLVAKGYYHLLAYKGASYHHAGADVRVFPISWLGVRAFVDTEQFRIPQNSIKNGLDASLDRTGTGLGVVVRF